MTNIKPDLISDIESDIIRFIDNSKDDMLIMHKSNEWYETMLFWKNNFEELCKEYFWEDPEFIKNILNKINLITVDELMNDYKFNIWFNEWYKQWINSTLSQMENIFQDKSWEIIEELWSITKEQDEQIQ